MSGASAVQKLSLANVLQNSISLTLENPFFQNPKF